MNDKKINEHFGKYRKERIKRECPTCSDLWHGFYEAWSHQQTKINKLEKENELLRENQGKLMKNYDIEIIERKITEKESAKLKLELEEKNRTVKKLMELIKKTE